MGIVVVEADRRKLDGMSRTHAHQGVIALAAVRQYVSVDALLDRAAAKGEPPLLVICDEISDPIIWGRFSAPPSVPALMV